MRGTMEAQLTTAMTVAEAAAAFDGCQRMHTSDAHEGERDFTGFSRLIAAVRTADGMRLTWDRGEWHA